MTITFVCTGNASRSAVAEVILKSLLDNMGVEDVFINSCGTSVPESLGRELIMCRIAAEHGYRLGGAAVPATRKILEEADLIIVMTAQHRKQVCAMLDCTECDKIHIFNEFCFGETSDLPDPHYQTEYVYRTCFARIEEGCKALAERIIQSPR